MTPTKGTTVTKRRRVAPVRVPKFCTRCKRRLSSRELRDSMANLRAGKVTSCVGTCCLTLADMAEMTVNAACTEIALNVRDGLLLTRPKRAESDDDARRLA
jgi:hypothetical protein